MEGVPDDNPFVGRADVLSSIWTYGHRSPQGLEFDRKTGQLWGTEMGPRGGDELNLLLPGRNYGWPLTSKGVDYDGTPVEYGKELGIEFDPADIEQPVVDMTPSPAVASFVLYEGAAFPAWQRNFLVGSLKATELYRMVRDGRPRRASRNASYRPRPGSAISRPAPRERSTSRSSTPPGGGSCAWSPPTDGS